MTFTQQLSDEALELIPGRRLIQKLPQHPALDAGAVSDGDQRPPTTGKGCVESRGLTSRVPTPGTCGRGASRKTRPTGPFISQLDAPTASLLPLDPHQAIHWLQRARPLLRYLWLHGSRGSPARWGGSLCAAGRPGGGQPLLHLIPAHAHQLLWRGQSSSFSKRASKSSVWTPVPPRDSDALPCSRHRSSVRGRDGGGGLGLSWRVWDPPFSLATVCCDQGMCWQGGSWSPGSSGEVTSGDCVCLKSRDVLTDGWHYQRMTQTPATFHTLKWAAAGRLAPCPGGAQGEAIKAPSCPAPVALLTTQEWHLCFFPFQKLLCVSASLLPGAVEVSGLSSHEQR